MRMMMLLIGLSSLMACSTAYENLEVTETLPEATARITAGCETEEEKLERIYTFVRDEIEFNWVYPQDIPAEQVLANGCGVCMQKANLFSALARESGFTTRFRFVYVHKQALEDFVPEWAYKRWQNPFPHTVVEVYYQGNWISFDPSFDTELMTICLEEELNFGKYPEIVTNFNSDFAIDGVKGAQEYWAVEGMDSFYGEDLSPLMEYENEVVPVLKQRLKPLIFRKAREMMDELREDY